ncbi:MAG: hypothetical protein EOO91_17895 [Pedobacter sp.]|nr:MAG: hypothetical protein EOO91_17895 [Pedobacter sp.]
MSPFGIVIKRAGKQLALNIHPKYDVGFMVLFEGTLVGEIFLDVKGRVVKSLSARELMAEGYPDYPCDESEDCEGLLKDQEMLRQIEKEIDRKLSLDPDNLGL